MYDEARLWPAVDFKAATTSAIRQLIARRRNSVFAYGGSVFGRRFERRLRVNGDYETLSRLYLIIGAAMHDIQGNGILDARQRASVSFNRLMWPMYYEWSAGQYVTSDSALKDCGQKALSSDSATAYGKMD